LTVVRDAGEFANLEAKWNALVRKSGATIYQTFEWTSLWWKYFGSGSSRALHCILFTSGETLVGIAPLYAEATRVAGVVLHRNLQFLGCGSAFSRSNGLLLDDGASDYLDFIADQAYRTEICRAFIEYLERSDPPFDEVQLVNTPEESPTMAILRRQCAEHGFELNVTQADVCSRMNVPESFEGYLKAQSPNVRRRFVQARKEYQEGGTLTVSTVGSSAELEEAFAHLVRLHQHRWNALGFPGLFADRKFGLFQLDVARAFMRQGWLTFRTANAGGTCIATRLAFSFNGCLYDYLSGFDPKLSTTKQRPGLALLLSMIEDAIPANVTKVDFLRGDERYKFEFNPAADHNWNIRIARASGRRTLKLLLYRLVKKFAAGVYLLARERALIGVQWRTHGVPGFLLSYVQFRLKRITGKFTKHNAPPGDAVQRVSISENSQRERTT
jgi:CelD/BcsL family acetyltransferase involved in cellulose biosynthesis